MRIVLLADRLGEDLKPLTARLPVALLPIANRPLFELCLELIMPLSPMQLELVISAHSDRMREHIGDGQRWGLSIHCLLSRGNEPPAQVLRRLAASDDEELLILRADMLQRFDLKAFIASARASSASCVTATSQQQALGVWYCRAPDGVDAVPGWPLPKTPHPACSPIEVAASACFDLADLASFHRANLTAAALQIEDWQPAGREVEPGLWLGRGADCAGRLEPQAQVILGTAARVMPGAQLAGSVVIGDGVIVDRNCSVKDSVLLAHSYVGAEVELNQAIVCGNQLMRMDTGAQLKVVDAFLLADLNTRELREQLRDAVHRLGGLVLLLLSLPLWPLALVFALRGLPAPLLKSSERIGNVEAASSTSERCFRLWQWNTRIPLLRNLPGLLAVIRGHLRLFGIAPLSPAEAAERETDWPLLADSAPAGLLGPTQLLLDHSAPLEERMLSDVLFIRQRSLRGDALLLLRALASLFSRRAWQAQERT